MINEVAYFTFRMVKQLLNTGETEIFQTKMSAIRKIRISNYRVEALKKFNPERLSIFNSAFLSYVIITSGIPVR